MLRRSLLDLGSTARPISPVLPLLPISAASKAFVVLVPGRGLDLAQLELHHRPTRGSYAGLRPRLLVIETAPLGLLPSLLEVLYSPDPSSSAFAAYFHRLVPDSIVRLSYRTLPG